MARLYSNEGFFRQLRVSSVTVCSSGKIYEVHPPIMMFKILVRHFFALWANLLLHNACLCTLYRHL